MKKIILAILLAPLLMAGCQQKNAKPAESSEPTKSAVVDPMNEPTDSQPVEEDLSGKVISLTARDFKEKIIDLDATQGYRYKGKTPCVVDFYANWCRPCMNFKPIFHKLSEQYKGKVIFYQVDVDKAQDICSLFGIESIPTFIFFSQGAQPLKMVGAPTEQEMKKALDDFLSR